MSFIRRELWKDNIYNNNQKASRLKYWSDKDNTKRQSEMLRKKWEEKDYKENMIKVRKSDEYKEKRSIISSRVMKNKWKDEEFKEKMITMRNSDEYKERLKNSLKHIDYHNIAKKSWNNKQTRENRLNGMRSRMKKYVIKDLTTNESIIISGIKNGDVKDWCNNNGFSTSTFKRHIGKEYKGFLFKEINQV